MDGGWRAGSGEPFPECLGAGIWPALGRDGESSALGRGDPTKVLLLIPVAPVSWPSEFWCSLLSPLVKKT